MLQADVYSLPSGGDDFASVPARAGRMSSIALPLRDPTTRVTVIPEPATLSMVMAAAFLPVVVAGAGAVVAAPYQVDVYVLVGSTIAMLLSVAWMRHNKTSAGFWPTAFTVLSSIALGWILPEAIFWTFFPKTAEGLPSKLWALLGLICGLCGSTAVVAFLKSIEKRLPQAVDQVITSHLPPSPNLPQGAKVEVTVPAQTKTDPP